MTQDTYLDLPSSSEFLVPSNAPVQSCRSCAAAIIWITTAKGCAMPLHAAAIKAYKDGAYAPSHFAYCKDAEQWRKPK